MTAATLTDLREPDIHSPENNNQLSHPAPNIATNNPPLAALRQQERKYYL
jgi:hypothetical protein